MGVLQTDECDEEADTDGNRGLEALRDGVEDRFTDVCQRHGDEDQTFDKDCGQSDFPAVAHGAADSVCEVGIQAKAGAERERLVGERSHAEAGDRGSHGSRKQNGTAGVFKTGRGAENRRIQCENVHHGHEGGETGNQFCLKCCAVLFKLEQFF